LFFCIGVGILRNQCDNLMNKPMQWIVRDSSAQEKPFAALEGGF
jgi:hypothetical protein